MDATQMPAPDLYIWLAGVFAREQTADTLATLRSRDGRGALLGLAAATGARAGAERLLAVVAAEPDPIDLAADFSRLFLGAGGPRLAVAPYESVHTSPQGTLFQQATFDMEGLLDEHRLTLAATSEPADHIAVELEFLGRLTAECLAGAGAETVARRRKLLDEHLLRWAPDFCALCIERDRGGFYAAAAGILAALMQAEAAAAA